jgi:hypothetical protein
VSLEEERLMGAGSASTHQACDQQDIEVAWELPNVLDFMAKRRSNLPTGLERRDQEGLVAAHERLWQIRQAAAAPGTYSGGRQRGLRFSSNYREGERGADLPGCLAA